MFKTTVFPSSNGRPQTGLDTSTSIVKPKWRAAVRSTHKPHGEGSFLASALGGTSVFLQMLQS